MFVYSSVQIIPVFFKCTILSLVFFDSSLVLVVVVRLPPDCLRLCILNADNQFKMVNDGRSEELLKEDATGL